jgi:hypothetical protein
MLQAIYAYTICAVVEAALGVVGAFRSGRLAGNTHALGTVGIAALRMVGTRRSNNPALAKTIEASGVATLRVVAARLAFKPTWDYLDTGG